MAKGRDPEAREEREPWSAQLRFRTAQDWKQRPRFGMPAADVTFWVAVIFTFGSIAWVNAPFYSLNYMNDVFMLES